MSIGSSRQSREGPSIAGGEASSLQAQMPPDFASSPPLINASSDSQLAPVPVQILDDSSPEAEERLPPPNTPRDELTATNILEKVAPDSVPDVRVVPEKAVTETSIPPVMTHSASGTFHEPNTEEGWNPTRTEEAAGIMMNQMLRK